MKVDGSVTYRGRSKRAYRLVNVDEVWFWIGGERRRAGTVVAATFRPLDDVPRCDLDHPVVPSPACTVCKARGHVRGRSSL